MEGDSILPPLRTEAAESSDSDTGDASDSSYARGMAKSVLTSQGGEGIEQIGEDLRGQRVCDGLGRTQGLAFKK